MVIEKREVNEYHKNGQLMYETTFVVIDPMFEPNYRNIIKNDKGELLVRIGMTKRYWNNGQLNWQLKYNDNGSLSNEKFRSFRKDGSYIIH